FTPVLAVRGPDLDAEATRALCVVGDPFTLDGRVLREQSGQPVLGDQPLPPARPPSDVPLIASAELTVNAAAFPHIVLEVRPKDAQGSVIENLPAAHFLVEEEGRPVTALMERWARPAPRVLLLLDDSGSIPFDFRGAGAQTLVRVVAEQIKAAEPRARFRVAKIYEGTADTAANGWTDDPQSAADQVLRVTGFGSRLWESLADAARHDPTVIVMMTDGQATDGAGRRLSEPPPAALAAVQAGPPAVIIGVGELDPPMLERMGQAGRLGAFTAATQEEAIRAILKALDPGAVPPYRFSYRAPQREGDDQAPRTVRLLEQYGAGSKPRTALLAQASYTPPPPQARAELPALSGLFLTVSVGNQRVTRVLGGLSTSVTRDRPTPEDLVEVRRALQGRATLSFEAGAPPLAHQLDDAYTAMLSLRPVLEARDRAASQNAIAGSLLYLPPSELHVTNVPLPDRPDEPLTFQTGLRVTLHRILPAQTPDGKPAATRWVDVLPLAGFRTADPDPVRAFRLTAQRTARLALAEALNFPLSTVAALKGKSLRPARYESDILQPLRAAGADEATLRRVSGLFKPWLLIGSRVLWTGDATSAGWMIDPHGAMWGILGGDGAQTAGGGSGASPIVILDAAMLASSLAAMAGLGGFSFAGGVWLALAATLYKKLEAATALLAQLPVSPDDPAPNLSGADDIADFSKVRCALAQAAAFEAISRVGGAFFGEAFGRAVSAVSALDGARSMATGSGFFC
ncbi:MAG: VWA domain-containing protein, partial [Anaerolineae bacterium]|nr:VWA domain-containing protein [Anaerolineae bacterium]